MSAVTIPTPTNDTLWKILPRSATQLERDVLTVTTSDSRRELMMQVPLAKGEIAADSWLPALLMEYGYAELGKHFRDYRRLLNASKELRGKWGTPYAVEYMAHLMRYLDAEIWEQPEATIHFPEFQMDLGQNESSIQRLITLRKMVDIIKPASRRFRRVFHGWDDRQHRWDESFWGELWDTESGVDILPLAFGSSFRSDDQFIVSMRQDFTGHVVFPLLVILGNDEQTLDTPPILIEKTVTSHHTPSFGTVLDTDFFDGPPVGSFDIYTPTPTPDELERAITFAGKLFTFGDKPIKYDSRIIEGSISTHHTLSYGVDLDGQYYDGPLVGSFDIDPPFPRPLPLEHKFTFENKDLTFNSTPFTYDP